MYADLDFVCLQSMDKLLANVKGAVLARMGNDTNSAHSLPNAWVASTPGHGFWLFLVSLVQQRAQHGRRQYVEYVSGPVAVFDAYRAWHAAHGTTRDVFDIQGVEVLDADVIYPLVWGSNIPAECDVRADTFDQRACNVLFPHAFAITYCACGIHTRV